MHPRGRRQGLSWCAAGGLDHQQLLVHSCQQLSVRLWTKAAAGGLAQGLAGAGPSGARPACSCASAQHSGGGQVGRRAGMQAPPTPRLQDMAPAPRTCGRRCGAAPALASPGGMAGAVPPASGAAPGPSPARAPSLPPCCAPLGLRCSCCPPCEGEHAPAREGGVGGWGLASGEERLRALLHAAWQERCCTRAAGHAGGYAGLHLCLRAAAGLMGGGAAGGKLRHPGTRNVRQPRPPPSPSCLPAARCSTRRRVQLAATAGGARAARRAPSPSSPPSRRPPSESPLPWGGCWRE
jgi:hypothetical protein